VQHEQWVLDLAERLSGDGVIVILDKWDLKEGQDKHVFMEQMVNDKGISKVLVICDRGYQSKADDRKGGVGTETQLISREVYENTGQEKFIPVVKEYDQDGKPCIPHYMASRIYIDLSSDEIFEGNYQKLIRNLYNRPLLKKPPIGMPPAYITEEQSIILKTSHKVTEIKNAILSGRTGVNGLITDYLDAFIESLGDFRLSGGSQTGFDDKVVESIEKMLPLRDDFIAFAFSVFKYKDDVDLEAFQTFLERLLPFFYPPENVQSYTQVDCDNYKFFIYELVLNFFALLIQLKKYKAIAYFINSQYFFRLPQYSQLISEGIGTFNLHCRSLDEFRNNRLHLNRVSMTADLIKAHSIRQDIKFEEIVQVDLMLYYITELNGNSDGWFPRTSIYKPHRSNVDLFDRMVSLQYFEKIKDLFDVRNVEEMKKKIADYIERTKNQSRRYSGLWDYNISPIENVIDLKKLGTLK